MAISSATFSIGFVVTETRTVGLTSVNVPTNYQPALSFVDGVGALGIDRVYQGTLALSSGTNNVDLSGVLTDAFGGTLTPARVKVIAFRNNSASNIMTIGNGTNPFATWLGSTSTLIVRPGGILLCAAPDATGYAITAATGDILKVAGTGAETFDLLLGLATT